MRKTLAATAAALALVLSACGASGGSSEGAGQSPTTAAASDSTTTTTEAPTTTEATTTTTSDIPEDAVAVKDWADDFCGNFKGWITDIQTASTDVGKDINPGDINGGKLAIVKLFETASTETESLIGQIDAGGVPDVPDGDKLVDDLNGKFQDFNDAIEKAKAEAEALPTDDPNAFQSEVKRLTQTFQDETTKVGESFGELDAKYPSPELQSALSDSCKGI